MKKIPLVDKITLLKKFPGKGGWTYVETPEVRQDKRNPFGWVNVSGSIDDHVLQQVKLMPLGNGELFFPVKAQIRKKIGKQAGDTVRILLYIDDSELVIDEEIMACFEVEEPSVYANFKALNHSERKAYQDWILEAKTEETRVNRIANMMDRLSRNLRFHDKEE